MDYIFKIHGMPTSIILDQDHTFTNQFWHELFKVQGAYLDMRTTYHIQIDGQIEVVNKFLES